MSRLSSPPLGTSRSYLRITSALRSESKGNVRLALRHSSRDSSLLSALMATALTPAASREARLRCIPRNSRAQAPHQ
jgi:hypothetical protein